VTAANERQRVTVAIDAWWPPEPHEIIVVDDASSEATASIVRQQGAQVIRVEHRQIAATRNAGAQQAHGDILFFVDADTLTNAPAIQSALRAVRAGAIGGGCVPRSRDGCPWWFRKGESEMIYDRVPNKAAGNARRRSQFRFAVDVIWPRVPEFWTLDVRS